MSNYLRVLLILGIAVATFGVVGPYLISAKSTAAVLLGFGLIILVVIPLLYKLGKPLVVSLMEKMKESEL